MSSGSADSGGSGAGAHEIGYLLVDDVLTGDRLQSLAQELADTAQFSVAVGVFVPLVVDQISTHLSRALRDGHDRIIAGIAILVLD